jgi:predicted metal-dependent phosphoesterase TrpH
MHTTHSDGRLSPKKLVENAVAVGLEVISICDHDTLNGIPLAIETATDYPNLEVIPGVEISTDYKEGDVHVLGYFIDYASPELESKLKDMRLARLFRAKEMIAKLAALDMPLKWQRIKEIAGDGSVGRPHIAQAMLEKGYITDFDEAFHKYISRGGPAYVERIKLTPVKAVEVVLESGGLPVLAHPLTIPESEELIRELKDTGLVGLEAYYDGFTPEKIDRVLDYAARYDLIATGGSDFHGLNGHEEVELGKAPVPYEVAVKLIALAKKRRCPGAENL